MDADDINAQAEWELGLEKFEEAVALRKRQLLEQRSLWSRLFNWFPWEIKLTIRWRK